MSYGPYKEFVIDGANIICPLCMQMNDDVMSIPIRSALTLKSTDCVSVNIQHQRVCTEYDKMIIVSSPCICTKDNLPCKPIVTDWINRRGSVANVKANKHIMLLDDATIKCSRGNAMLSFVNSGQKSSVPVPDDGFISMPSTMRESGFFIRHPWNAGHIAAYNKGDDNISTIAVLFANGLGWSEETSTVGTLTNAFRHAIWQAMISNEYGEKIAIEVGNSHEEHPLALQQIDAAKKGGLVVNHLLNAVEADELVDLYNNIIGRETGLKNPDKNNSELAKLLLNVFLHDGLYFSMKYGESDFYTIVRKKITTDIFNNSIENIDNGLDVKDKERQNKRGIVYF